MNNRCPHCGKVMGSLAWKYPEIARMWSLKALSAPGIPSHSLKIGFKPEWVCPKDLNHAWTEGVQSVIKKNGKYPYCGQEKYFHDEQECPAWIVHFRARRSFNNQKFAYFS